MVTYRYGVVRTRITASQLVTSRSAVRVRSSALCFELNLNPSVGLEHRPRLHYITSTSPSAQCSAKVCKPGKGIRLRYTDSASRRNTPQPLSSPLQGGGRWFEPSIAHSQNPAR